LSNDPPIPIRSRQDATARDHTPETCSSTTSSTSVSPDRDGYAQPSSASSIDSDGDNFLPLGQRLNLRRSSATGVTPPTLRRGDETHKDFIEGLLVVTTSILQAIWPLSRETPRSSPDFNGGAVLPLRVFIQETCRRSRTSYSTLQIALYYLILLKGLLPALDFTREQPRESDICNVVPKDPQVLWGQPSGPSGCRVMQCGRRMFMSALMLAAKYLQDRNFSVKAWSKISGLSCSEINKNEKAYLQTIEYRLHLKKEHFENWSQIVLALCNSEKAKSGNLDYSKIVQNLKPEIIHDSDKTAHFLATFRKWVYFAADLRDDFTTPDWSIYNDLRITDEPSKCAGSKALGLALTASSSGRTDCRMPVASLNSCPPPYQTYSSMSTIPRQENISPPWSQSSASSSSSPESTFSENATRSRSSSISSTSSYEHLRSFRTDVTKATPYPSPLGRSCTYAAQAPKCSLSALRFPVLSHDQPSHLSVTPTRCQPSGRCAEGASSGAPLPCGVATEQLVIPNKQHGEHSLGPAAAEDQILSAKKSSKKRAKDSSTKLLKLGHTSEAAKAKRKLERETSRQLKNGRDFPDAVPDDFRQYGEHIPEEEKRRLSPDSFEDEGIVLEDTEHQLGSQPWAGGSKQPIPVIKNNCNKRLAADAPAMTAADLAARELRWEMEKHTGSVLRATTAQ
jgi:hypothetical protein